MTPKLCLFVLSSCLLLLVTRLEAAPSDPLRAGATAAVPNTTLEGVVFAPSGLPAQGAVVVSTAGGRAVTDEAGRYRLEVELAPEAAEVRVTAVHASGHASQLASLRELGRPGIGERDVAALHLSAGTSCTPDWLPTFPPSPGLNRAVRALIVHDDGAGGGPALYAGGEFWTAGGAPARCIARWDGASWSPVGVGMTGGSALVTALAVYDDGLGGGPALYAAGHFTSAGGIGAERIAKWDGTTWSPLGSGMNNLVLALTVYDDGSGEALYAGGEFTTAGGLTVNRVAKWDGNAWSSLGGGVLDRVAGGRVSALAVYDDGNGEALYAGGMFTVAGGQAVSHIARWDGASWSPIGSGVSSEIYTLTTHDDGSGAGPALYAGGAFGSAGGASALRVARWDGASWSTLGTGMNGSVRVLLSHDDGTGRGAQLYAGGNFSSAGGALASRAAKWDGTSWSPVSSGSIEYGLPGTIAPVQAMTIHDDGTGGGPALLIGGDFGVADGVIAMNIARLDGVTWTSLGDGVGGGDATLAVHDDGSGGGPALYAGGPWVGVNGTSGDELVLEWDGTSWSQVGRATGKITVMHSHDDGAGGGPALYIGGTISSVDGVPASRIARWNGSSWSPVGAGFDFSVRALAIHDDGTGGGAALYAAGGFSNSGGSPVLRIARWDGSSWIPVGGGMNSTVHALAVHDDGAGGGEQLYAAGSFSDAGGVAAARIARWDGVSWHPLGSGIDDPNGWVFALADHDDGAGGGPALYAGGAFSSAGGVSANCIARWDGASWSPLGSGIPVFGNQVRVLSTYDDGTGGGPALYVGGEFGQAGGVAVNNLARWDGASWAEVGTGIIGTVRSLVVHDDGGGHGSGLFVGGFIPSSPSGGASVAHWGGCNPGGPGVPYCFGDGSGSPCPCGNTGAAGQGCSHSGGVGAVLGAHGTASVAADDLGFVAEQLLAQAPVLLFVADDAVSGGAGSPFGDGLRCASGNVRRLGVRISDLNASASWGPGLAASGGWSAGQTQRFQAWYRDSPGSACGTGFNLTNGVEVAFEP